MFKTCFSAAAILSSVVFHDESVMCMDEMTTKANRIFNKAMAIQIGDHDRIGRTFSRLFSVRKDNIVLLNLLDPDKKAAAINRIGIAKYRLYDYQAAAHYWSMLFSEENKVKGDKTEEKAKEDELENTLFDRVGNYETELNARFNGDLEQGLLLQHLGESYCELEDYNKAIYYLDMLFLEKEFDYRHFDCIYYEIEDNKTSFITAAYFIAKAYFEIGNYHMARLHLDGNRKKIYKLYRGDYIKDDLKRMNKIMSAALRQERGEDGDED